VFRRDKSLPLDADLIKALYRGVLRREPGATEINNLINALSNAGSVEHALKDMLSSHEFGVMVLPDLINSYVNRVPDKPIFFLHVPKTAGTSFRLALTETMGVSAFLLYVHTTWQGFGRDATMQFWPLWAGHGGVSAFPQTHRGITVFREARSRTLSSFRQQQKELITGDHDGTLSLRRAKIGLQHPKSRTVEAGFSKWVTGSRTALTWFIDTPHTDGAYLWNGLPSHKFLKSLSPSEVRHSLSRSLSRFDAAAWAHDSDAMVRAIGLSTGVEAVSPMGRENEFGPAPGVETIRLTSTDLEQLNRNARYDQILIDIAVDQGLIPPLDPDFADAEFERTAQRLGFVLP
jgi:hypothetical protein